MELMQYLTNPWTRAIVVLIVFAGLDLMVGVSNDAVNFLNSAIGSKVASRKTIYRVAAVGILIGASFSGGMMEIARKGIFNPAMFSFYDIMIVFFSVIMADVILLDVYNTLKLPTSTTVSVVFELLGAGLAIALIHMVGDDLTISALGSFINASSTVTIISGIFLSVAIAFVAGRVIQTIMRTIFSFDYHHHIARRGWLFGGIAITAITYFLVVKGLKEAVFMPAEVMTWIQTNTRSTVGILFVLRSSVSFLVQRYLKRDILKVIVLIGTFALAAAFAGNDLVNFIGVSVAGYQAVMLYFASGSGDITQLMMGGLADKVSTPSIFLFGSAIIMIFTLMTSKKAQSVTETEIGLTQHATGQEQFKPGPISRWLVKKSIVAHRSIAHILPTHRQHNIAGRFVQSPTHSHQTDGPAFDLLRASINLTLSAVLIAMATNMKLPLSTTYVTFMVAMGTALADGARGRDSAVFRISGVLTIIGAWLMTAVIALTMTLILTSLLWNLGFWGVGVAVILVGYMLIRSHHRVTQPSSNAISESITDTSNLSDILLHQTVSILPNIQSAISLVIAGIMHDDEDQLTESYRQARTISTTTKQIKLNIHALFEQVGPELIQTGHTYVQGIEVLRKAALSIETMAEQCQEYVLNKHPDLISTQIDELNSLKSQLNVFLQEALMIIENNDFGLIPAFDIITTKLIDHLDVLKQSQFARIKAGETGIRNTTLYITILTELYTIVINIQKLVHYIRRVS